MQAVAPIVNDKTSEPPVLSVSDDGSVGAFAWQAAVPTDWQKVAEHIEADAAVTGRRRCNGCGVG